MTREEIESMPERTKKAFQWANDVIMEQNKKTVLIMSSHFGKLGIEHEFITPYALAENLPSSVYDYESSKMNVIRAIDLDKLDGNEIDNLKSSLKGSPMYALLHYPSIKVTNENNNSIIVNDLYVLVGIVDNVFNTMKALVATYDRKKAAVGYAFSHIPRVSRIEDLKFNGCCLGNCPINSLKTRMATQSKRASGVRDELISMMCMNIDRYFHVESISGGPYVKMSEVKDAQSGKKGNVVYYNIYSTNTSFAGRIPNDIVPVIKKAMMDMYVDGKVFVKRVIRGNPNPRRGSLNCSIKRRELFTDDEYRFCINFTKYFKRAYAEMSLLKKLTNTEVLLSNGLLKIYGTDGKKLYTPEHGSSGQSIVHNNGMFLFNFKGKPVHLSVTGDDIESNNHENIFINIELSIYIHSILLGIIGLK